MAIRTSEATWIGTLKEGHGTMKLGSGFFEGPYTFGSRSPRTRGQTPRN